MSIRTHLSIQFAIRHGFRPLELDLYLPPIGAQPTPAVVFIHGGGWYAGTRQRAASAVKSWDPGLFQQLASAGIAVASIDYRLGREASYPAPVHDARDALRWLRMNAQKFAIDPDRIGVWGASAGGLLAALVALDATGDGELDDTLSGVSGHVKSAVLWFPVTDLVEIGKLGHAPEAMLLGAPAADDLELARHASPITHVHRNAPPFLLQHGTADTDVPPDQSTRFADALHEADGSAVVDLVPDADHIWVGVDDTVIRAIFQRALAFLQSTL
jgi:acetyl esterase/lipase